MNQLQPRRNRFAWLCSNKNRKVLAKVEADLRRDIAEMRENNRRRWFIFLVVGWHFSSTCVGMVMDAVCHQIQALNFLANHNTIKHPNASNKMKKQMHFLLLTGWLIPVAGALSLFALWIKDILVPTLKGGSFDQLYDLHGIRYLDTTLVFAVVAFVWFSVAVFRLARKQINGV